MNEKTKSENGKPILLKKDKVYLLIFAIFLSAVFTFNLYFNLNLEFRRQINRQIMCNQINIMNSQIPPSDIESYLIRKISFEKACTESTERTGWGSYFWVFASFSLLGYAINLFRKNPK